MASAEIICEKENIERDNATVSGRCSGFTASSNKPNGSSDWSPSEGPGVTSGTAYDSEIRYTITRYEWTFNPGAGIAYGDTISGFVISGLNAGEEVVITATVKCYEEGTIFTKSGSRSRSYDKETDTYGDWVEVWSGYENKGSAGEKALDDTAYAEKTIYTKPEEFSWNGSVGKDKTIQTPEFSAAWDKLVETAGKRQNYEHQEGGNDYSSYNAESNALITAAGYNAIAKACNVSKTVNKDDIIYASLYEDLATSINNYPW